jgi:glycosyltransferase involved in cell wall biosynthesis
MKTTDKEIRKVSLVIPVKNESDSLAELLTSIAEQTFEPDEILLVDGGSTDNTVELAEQIAAERPRIKFFKTLEASPGKGRNIGIENAKNEWIALTDAGIKLETDWLENLVKASENSPGAALIYGNFFPVTGSLFEKCAAIAYVPALRENSIRGRSVASMMLKKKVWETIGGFPDRRAAEDLMFMEAAEKKGFQSAFAPSAVIYWQLRPDLASTFRKFILYSKHNVWAGRTWDWHYGVAKQYALVLPFIVLAVAHSSWWLLTIPVWLAARTAKRILHHRHEFGLGTLFNPLVFGLVALLVLTIDFATFIGWGQAILSKSEN